MQKRNFTLLIIILVIVVIAVFGFLYFRDDGSTPGDDGGTNFISRFNPFASNPPPPATTPPENVPVEPPPEEVQEVKLTKVSSMPIAGFGVFNKERLKEVPIEIPPEGELLPEQTPTPPTTEFAPALRYVERATGNIYQTFADEIAERKFSNTIIPKVYEAHFGNKGESVVMRYLKTDEKTIETFVGNLPKEYLGGDTASNNEIKGSFLPDNVKDVSISPDTLKIFYLFESGDGESMIGTTLNLTNNKKVQVFDSPFTEWLSWWPSDKVITLSTKPSWNSPGYMYSMDPDKKNPTRVLGDINGLTTMGAPNGKLVLYGDSNLSLYVYQTDTRNANLLGLRTLPEKCVWGKLSDAIYCAVPKSIAAATYPDSWYQGEVSFGDAIWKINVADGSTTMISDPATVTSGGEIDGIKLALDDGENYLFFVNKKDSFLWRLELR